MCSIEVDRNSHRIIKNYPSVIGYQSSTAPSTSQPSAAKTSAAAAAAALLFHGASTAATTATTAGAGAGAGTGTGDEFSQRICARRASSWCIQLKYRRVETR